MKTDRPFTADFGLDLRRRLQLGAGQPQGHSRRAVERSTPTLMLLYSLVVLWFDREGDRRWLAPAPAVGPRQAAPQLRRHAGGAAAAHTGAQPPRLFRRPRGYSGYEKSRRRPPGIRQTGRMRRRKCKSRT